MGSELKFGRDDEYNWKIRNVINMILNVFSIVNVTVTV
jgi:hypothetical protein